MIDLNHNSRYVPGRAHNKPHVPQIGELINGLIDEALERERAAQPERDYIGMSELGDPCLRRVFYGAEKALAKPFEGSKLRIFETGHVYEAMVARWLRAAGFSLHTHDELDDGSDYEVATYEGIIKGHIDGFADDGPRYPGLVYPFIWENKALGSKWWKLIVKNGVQFQEPKYYGQCQLYIGYFEVQNALFSAVNKDTEEVYWEIIPFDLAEAQRFSDRSVDVINALDVGVPPARICPNPTFFEAKWCRHADFCFGDER
jgi:hypothetical protein